MLPRIQLFSSLIAGTAMMFCAAQAGAQAPDLGWVHWDSSNQVLFSEPGPGLISRTSPDGSNLTIDIFKNFAGLQDVRVESVTAGPDGAALIAAVLAIRDQKTRAVVLTYGRSGELLKTWDLGPQDVDVIRYASDNDAVFLLGDRDVPDGAGPTDYPVLGEYSRDGRMLKSLIPASKLKDGGESLRAGSETGQPALRVTKDNIYFYAPKDREVVMCDRNGEVLASRSISGVVEELSRADGYYVVQTHHVDFTDDGDIVLEILLENDSIHSYLMDVVRVSIKTGQGVLVHRASNGRFWFIGVKNDQFLYVEHGQNLYLQSPGAQELLPWLPN
jgi:hypothetical protein